MLHVIELEGGATFVLWRPVNDIMSSIARYKASGFGVYADGVFVTVV